MAPDIRQYVKFNFLQCIAIDGETMPSDAPAARASSFDFAASAAKRPRRPGASMRLSALRAALSWICTKKESTIVDSSLLS